MTDAPAIDDSGNACELNSAAHLGTELSVTLAAANDADPALPRVLTPEELAKVLRVRRRSVYEAISRGDIPGVRRIGRKVRIDRDSVLAWLADGHGRAPRSSRR